MSASVLYDVPGPRSVRRHRLYAAGTVVVLLALAAYIGYVLADKGQLDSSKWDFLAKESTWRALRVGFTNTFQAAIVAIALSLAFGAVFAAARLSEKFWLRWPAVVVVEFFRAVPLLLLILFVFLAYGGPLTKFWSLVLALMLYNGSVLAEIFRAGIASVPRGQAEAAYALGMRKYQVMTLVLIPQSVRIMLPAIISQSVVALKDTSLGFIIAYEEAARVTSALFNAYRNPLQAGLVVAAIYVLINYALSRLAVVLEARQRRRPGGRPAPTAIGSGSGAGGASAP